MGMGRWGLFLVAAGGLIGFLGYHETRIRWGSSIEPEDVTLEELIRRGGEGNTHFRVRDFALVDDFVIEEKNGRWSMVYIPAFPRAAGQLPMLADAPPGPVPVIVMSGQVHSEGDVVDLGNQPTLAGMVINRVKSLSSQQRNLLAPRYPDTDFDKCLIFNHGRATIHPHVALGGLISGGLMVVAGLVLMLVAYKRYGTILT
jgi:hypothetical protein